MKLYLSERAFDLIMDVLFAFRRENAFRGLLDLSGCAPGDKVLDAGCGSGWLTRRIAERVDPGEVLGIDPTPNAIGYATKRGGAQERYEVASMTDVPAAANTFDKALTSLVLHHVEVDDQPRAFADLYRVLKPGGELFVIELRRPTSRWIKALIGWQGCVKASLSEERLRRLAQDAGFSAIELGTHWRWLSWMRAKK